MADLEQRIQAVLADFQAGNKSAAEHGARTLTETAPQHPFGWKALGTLLAGQGASEAAVPVLEKAHALAPEDAEVLCSLGKARRDQSQFAEAETCFRAAIAQRPDLAEAHNNLGSVLKELERFDEALVCYQTAIAHNPHLAQAHNNLGNLLKLIGRPKEAPACYRRALELQPDYAQAYNNLANVLKDLGQGREALECYARALEIDPNYADAHYNRANTLQRMGRLGEAREAYERALALKPNFADACNNLGSTLKDLGLPREGLQVYARALALKPDMTMAQSNWLLCHNYCADIPQAEVFAAHQRVNERAVPALPPLPHPLSTQAERRLRLGLISADLRTHSVAFFLRAWFEHRSHDQFELFCYANNARRDDTTEVLERQSDAWIGCEKMKDAALAERIRADRVDILFDLAGHSAGNRMPVFAARPAPLQVSWIGYPNTTGLETMDYRLVDAITDPPGTADPFHSERLIRLPDGFLCYRPPLDPARLPLALPPCTLDAWVTFGSFNNLAKIGADSLQLWGRLLQAVPNSRLLLKSGFVADPSGWDAVTAALHAQGIDLTRVEVLARTASQQDHFALYNRIDIALDTYPYNGTTTTCEALFMGVPVVTERGDRHVSRVGASLLARLELDELVASSGDDYVRIAAALAADPERLRRLRATMRARLAASALCDERGQTRTLERALRQMWRLYCQGEAPQVFEVPSARDPTQLSPRQAAEQALTTGALERLQPPRPTRGDQWLLNSADGIFIAVPADLELTLPYVLLEQEVGFELELPLLRRLVQPGMRLLDTAAAPFGLHTLTMAQALEGQGHIDALVSGTARLLATSLDVNAFEGLVRLWPAATELVPAPYDLIRFGQGTDAGLRERVLAWLADAAPCDPLVVFQYQRDRAPPERTLLERLQTLGLDIYRQVPGLDALIPVGDLEPLDDYHRTLFACTPARAAHLRASGLLLIEQDLVGETPPPARQWAHELATLPYVRHCHPSGDTLGAWQRLDRSADVHWPDYERALNACLSAADPSHPLATRWHWLQQAQAVLQHLDEAGDQHLGTRLLRIRVLFDIGERRASVQLNHALHQAMARDFPIRFDRPFLPADPRFDQRSVATEGEKPLVAWIQAAITEPLERRRAFSSYFHREARLVDELATNPNRAIEMDRRRALIALRAKQPWPLGADHPVLHQDAAGEHRNPEIWRQLMEHTPQHNAAQTPTATWTLNLPLWPESSAAAVRMALPGQSEQMTPYVLLEQDDWFEPERAFLCRLLEPGMRVIDAGAGYGVYALTLAQRLRDLGGGGQVLAVEPAATPAALLAQSRTDNQLTEVLTLRRLALSHSPGTAMLKQHPTPELTTLSEAPGELIVTTLDALLGDPAWGDGPAVIDVLKLDVVGHEDQALHGAERLVREHNPLILFDAGTAKTPATPLRQRLARHGYQCYRLIPGLDALLPLDPQRPLDAFDINLFACKPERAAQLQAAGRLLTQEPHSAAPPPQRWPAALAERPYVRAVRRDGQALAAWQRLERGADPHWPAYERALNASLSAADAQQPLAQRAAWLGQAQAALEQLRANGDAHLATRLLQVRVLAAAGERARAAHTALALVEALDAGLQVRLERPFLPPLPLFDTRPPAGGDIGTWLHGLILESAERLRGFSGYFERDAQAAATRLKRLLDNPNHSPQMQRRLLLLAQRRNLTLAPERPWVFDPNDHTNPEPWREIAAALGLEVTRAPEQAHTGPLITLCLPSHNQAQALQASLWHLQQILADWPHDYEILVVDQASSDETRYVSDAFASANARMRVIRTATTTDESLHSARQAARGRAFLVLKPGDRPDLTALEQTLARMG